MNGTSWSVLPTQMLDNRQDDYESVAADPTKAGHAYLIWTNYPLTMGPPKQNQILFSKTTNGGRSFSLPTPIHRAPRGSLDVDSRLVVLSDGSLLVVFAQIAPSTLTSGTGPFALYATRSSDQGKVWSAPVMIRTGSYSDVVDPTTGIDYVPYCCSFSLAAGPNGSAHVAWTTNLNVS